MNRYVVTRAAREDLQDVRSYLTKEVGADVAHHVIHALVATFRMLAEFPGIGRERTDLVAKRILRTWPTQGYLIVYVRGEPLSIVRVLHQHRDVSAELKQAS